MDQRMRVFITFVILVVVLFGLYAATNWISRTTGYVLGEDEKMSLAICLAQKGAVFYVSDSCAECDAEKKIFGEDAFAKLIVVNCDKQPLGCKSVENVPAWRIEDNFVYGFQSFKELSSFSTCPLK